MATEARRRRVGIYNFKERFAAAILSGAKRQTIWAMRKRPDRPGNTLHLYTGLRTKKAKLLMRATCVHVEPIHIRETVTPPTVGRPTTGYVVILGGNPLPTGMLDVFARAEGFEDFAEMRVFWKEQKLAFPWWGHVIHWRKP